MTNNTLPKVAVLMAAYNGMQWIEEQVNSIFAQQEVDVTLFVSVDLSTDGTDQWVRGQAERNNKVIMLPYGERFGGAGPNFYRLIRDVDFSGFDAVSFADQDDVWFSDKLLRACLLLQKGNFDVYSSNVIAFWSDGKQMLIDKAQQQKKYDHFFESAGPGCTFVFNSAPAMNFKYFVINLGITDCVVSGHDWLAYAFCRHNGYKWFIDTKPSMMYRQHESNQAGANYGPRTYIKRFKQVSKKLYRQQVMIIINLVAPGMEVPFARRLFLLKNIRQLRRRPRDVFVLWLFIIFRVF
jgi:rhamnosyltransferase